MHNYPPIAGAALSRLKAEIALIPERHREDALQEAWVAYLEGGNPLRAVKAYAFREGWRENKQIASGLMMDY